jgi:hypothetical protein
MKLIKNTGADRVIDELRRCLDDTASLDLASPAFSLFAFAEIRDALACVSNARMVLPTRTAGEVGLLGVAADRPFRNRLQAPSLARQCASWIEKKAEIREAGMMPQSMLIMRSPEASKDRVVFGSCSFSTEGLGITPGHQWADPCDGDAGRIRTAFRLVFQHLERPAHLARSEKRPFGHTQGFVSAEIPGTGLLSHALSPFPGYGRRVGRGSHRQVGDWHSQHDRLEKAVEIPARWRRRRHR